MRLRTLFTRTGGWILIGLAPLAGMGCGGGPAADEGVLRVGNGTEPSELDPHVVTGVQEHRVLSALFEGLCDVDPATGEAVPGMAERWEVSGDGLVYTFHLREDARWSDGAPLTAEDFVFSWRRILSPKLGAEYAYMLHCIENAGAYTRGEITDFSEVGVEALDARTLRVRLSHPTPYFLTMQYHMAWWPVQRAAIEAHGAPFERGVPWTRAGNHTGNGAYRLKAWHPNEYILVERNPHYWDAENVRIPAIRFYPIDNQQTEERQFHVGELHITDSVPLDRIPRYQRDAPEKLVNHPYLGVYFYRFNLTRPPLDDVRVRRALQLSIQRAAITNNILRAGEEPAHFYTPPDTAGYTCATRVPEDAAKARELLAAAGYPGGAGMPRIEILYNTLESHKLIAEAIQQMWQEHLGVRVGLFNQDWKTYLSSMNNLDYDIARSAWIGDVVDPVNFLECFLSDGGNNRTGFASEEFDALIHAAYAETDPARRHAHLQAAEKILLDEAVIMPIYFYRWTFLKAPEVKGFVPNTMGYKRWKDLYLEPDAA